MDHVFFCQIEEILALYKVLEIFSVPKYIFFFFCITVLVFF